jgi:uncharacterized protein
VSLTFRSARVGAAEADMQIELPLLTRPVNTGFSWPDSPHFHLFSLNRANFVLVADGSQVFELSAELAEWLMHAEPQVNPATLARVLGIEQVDYGLDTPLTSAPVRAISLAISQTCNLACSYCYAHEGHFGGAPKLMSREVAFRAIDFLVDGAEAGERMHISFLGGEPLTGRAILHEAVEYARQRAAARGIQVGFAITTNGTLISAADIELFARHAFSVTVSLDGIGNTHDALRPHKNGSGTFAQIMERIIPLLERQDPMQVTARVTVTPRNLGLTATLLELLKHGFHSVGFSPMLASPTGRDQMDTASLKVMLDEMVSCGRLFEERVLRGERFPFSNMASAMVELHRGTHRPYPCGAGASYMGVSADGDLSACHRFVDDASGYMGSLNDGVSNRHQSSWLASRHVDRQEPCQSCWARYLCGGGCHHEVIHRGRPACEYIRGWLDYCLGAYVRLLSGCPAFFAAS